MMPRSRSQARSRGSADAAPERRLLELAAVGDQAAREELFGAYQDLVARLAEVRAGRGLSLEDLLQEGEVGLLAAITGHQSAPEGSFRERVEREVSRQMEIALEGEAASGRAARQLTEDAAAYEQAEISIHRLRGRAPTIDELAEKLEWSQARTRRLADIIGEARRRHDQELPQYIDPDDLVGN